MTRPAWMPTLEQKLHADAGCAHPDVCKVQGGAEPTGTAEREPEPEHTRPPEVPEALDALLDGIEVTANEAILIECARCDVIVCSADDGDSLAVLLRLAVEHFDTCEKLR